MPLADSCFYQTTGGSCVGSTLANLIVLSCLIGAVVASYLVLANRWHWLPFRPCPWFWRSWAGRLLRAAGRRLRELDDQTTTRESLRRDEQERLEAARLKAESDHPEIDPPECFPTTPLA
jgi:hypothetical protein